MRERHKLFEHLGRVDVQKDDLDKLPDWLQQMMARLIVLRVENRFEEDAMTYIALNPQFRLCPLGGEAPRYRAVVEDGRFLRFES